MPTINQLSAISTLTAGDLFALFSTSNGDARKCAVSVLQSYLQANLTFTASGAVAEYVTQYAAPAASGFNVAVTDGDDNIWLILTPLAGYAAGTITLPASSGAVDKQQVNVNCTQAVTTLTIGANGASAVVGAPTALTANQFFTLRFDAATSNWYRVA